MGTVGNYTCSNKIYKADINDDGSLSSWGQVGTLPSGRCYCSSVHRSGVIYIIGGYDGTNTLSDCLIYEIYEDGTLGYSGNSLLPSPVRSCTVIATVNKIYVIGGSDQFANNPITTVYSSIITQNGRPEAWET